MICRTCHGRGVVYEVSEGIDLTQVRSASVPHLVAPMPCPAPGCFGGEIACCEGDQACNDAETHFGLSRTSTSSASSPPAAQEQQEQNSEG